jgi:single-stranded DNA-specific DHH superfamily exonuclease
MVGDDIESVEHLDNYAKDVQREINVSIERFEKEKISFKNDEGYFWEFAPEFFIRAILINDLCAKYPNKTLIVVQNNDSHYEISARRGDERVNIVGLLKDLTKGFKASSGGHTFAAGATILPKDIAMFRERLRSL